MKNKSFLIFFFSKYLLNERIKKNFIPLNFSKYFNKKKKNENLFVPFYEF